MAELSGSGMADEPASEPSPRAVRVEVSAGGRLPGDEPLVVQPADGVGAAGASSGEGTATAGEGDPPRLDRIDARRAVLHTAEGRHPVLFGVPPPATAGRTSLEVVADGWRVELEVEPERRARLRERASARRGGGAAGGPLEVRAIIPGRIVAVSTQVGDEVAIGQQLLVIEAMKMQNELRATRAGTISRIAVEAGRTIEVGDLLLVME